MNRTAASAHGHLQPYVTGGGEWGGATYSGANFVEREGNGEAGNLSQGLTRST